MDDLVVDGELTALIADDKHADTATAVVERVLKAVEQVALVKDRKALLDITSLGHGDNAAVITDVENAVLLEDRTDHVLDNHGWAWVADERALLVQLLGEQVNTEIAVLASLCRGGDADDLAWAALEDEQVTDADVVAWDGDGVWSPSVARGAVGTSAWCTHGDLAVLDNDVFFDTLSAARVVVRVVVVVALEWVQDLVSGAANSVAEGVVVSVFVVISHVPLVFTLGVTVNGALLDLHLLVELNWVTLGVTLGWVLTWVGRLVLPHARSFVLLGEWGGAVAVLTLVDVDARVEVDLSGWSVTGWVLAVVDAVLNVDLSVGVPLVWLSVADAG